MFGMNKGMADMIANMIGVDPEELKAQAIDAVNQLQVAKEKAEVTAQNIINNQHAIYHKLTRVEKMLEHVMREQKIDFIEGEENGTGKRVTTN